MAEKDKTGNGQMVSNALGFFFKKQAEKLEEFERECIEKDLRGDKDRFDGFYSLLEKDEAAEAMIDASVYAVSKAQDDTQTQDLKEQFERQQLEERARRENMPMVYVLKEQYRQLAPAIIREKEEKYHCVLIPAEEHEIQRMKEIAVSYTIPPKLPDLKVLQPAVYDIPYIKGGRYHEPPRDLKKKKKAKRRQQKQSRRRNK